MDRQIELGYFLPVYSQFVGRIFSSLASKPGAQSQSAGVL